MKKLITLTCLGLQLSYAQSIPKENIIAYYAFEQNAKDSSTYGRDLNAFSLQSGNDTVDTHLEFTESRIIGMHALRKSDKIQGCNFSFPFCDTITKFRGLQSPLLQNNATDGFSLSYWVLNRTGSSSSYSRHISLFDSISTVQFSGSVYSLITSQGSISGPQYDKFGFNFMPYSSSGNGYYVGNHNSDAQQNSNLSWKNVVYIFSKSDSTIKSYVNGQYNDSWKLNKHSFDYVFTQPFHLVTDQRAGIAYQVPAVLARAIDDVILFNKTLSESEISALQSYPEAPTLTHIKDQAIVQNNGVRAFKDNDRMTVESIESSIESIFVYNTQGVRIATYSGIGQRQFDLPSDALKNGIYIAQVQLSNQKMVSLGLCNIE